MPAAGQFDGGQVAAQFQDTLRQRLFGGERAEHALFDGGFADEIDYRDRARLVFAPGAGNALFEFGWIPRQIAVDDHAGVLEVEAGAAAIGAEKDAAIRIGLESVDLGAATALRNASMLRSTVSMPICRCWSYMPELRVVEPVLVLLLLLVLGGVELET